MANFLLRPILGDVFGLILPIYNRIVCLSSVRLHTKFGSDAVKIQKFDVTLQFFTLLKN